MDALQKRGFRTNFGIHGSGVGMLVSTKAGGFYLGRYLCISASPYCCLTNFVLKPDIGASQLIADGKIKLKNDSQIREFTETGFLFEDGSQLPADVVVFATGYIISAFSCHVLNQDQFQLWKRSRTY